MYDETSDTACVPKSVIFSFFFLIILLEYLLYLGKLTNEQTKHVYVIISGIYPMTLVK